MKPNLYFVASIVFIINLLTQVKAQFTSIDSACYGAYMQSGFTCFQKGNYKDAHSRFYGAKDCNIQPPMSEALGWTSKSELAVAYMDSLKSDELNEDYTRALIHAVKILELNPKDKYARDRMEYCKAQTTKLQNSILVLGGEFEMGSDDQEHTEGPVHLVSVSSFFIYKFEITNHEYARFLNNKTTLSDDSTYWINMEEPETKIVYNNGKYSAAEGFEMYPVVNVNWFGAQAYCKWKGVSLPTEAEWEYAAKQGKSNDYFITIADTSSLNIIAWYKGNSGLGPHRIATKKPNAIGISDMAGNVYEWCADWYEENYYYHTPKKNPNGPPVGDFKVVKGGAFQGSTASMRSTRRHTEYPQYGRSTIGFRYIVRLDQLTNID